MMMKNTLLCFSFIAMSLLFSCTQGDKSDKKAASAKADLVAGKYCFVAVDGQDTARLQVDSLSNGKIKGQLVINYLEKGKNDGQIDGVFKGDTLFVDYTFKIGTENKTVYKNPLALLKKDGKMILGVGQIETSLGKSYFVKGKPISFDRGRFIFEPTECK